MRFSRHRRTTTFWLTRSCIIPYETAITFLGFNYNINSLNVQEMPNELNAALTTMFKMLTQAPSFFEILSSRIWVLHSIVCHSPLVDVVV